MYGVSVSVWVEGILCVVLGLCLYVACLSVCR